MLDRVKKFIYILVAADGQRFKSNAEYEPTLFVLKVSSAVLYFVAQARLPYTGNLIDTRP